MLSDLNSISMRDRGRYRIVDKEGRGAKGVGSRGNVLRGSRVNFIAQFLKFAKTGQNVAKLQPSPLDAYQSNSW